MASSLIGSLRVALGLDTAQFEAGAKKSRSVAMGLSRDIESSFKSAKIAVEGLVAAFAIGALTNQIKQSLQFAAAIGETASTLGVTTKQLQEYRFAASQTGVAQEQLEGGLQRLTVSMGKAQVGSQAQVKAFNAIGISLDEIKGKNTGQIFEKIADGLKNVTDRSQRAAVEVALFGRTGASLDALLSGGTARLSALGEAAQQLGVVLSDQQIQDAEVTAHKLEALKTVLEANIASTVAANANSILSLAQALSTLTNEILHFFSSNPQLALAIIGGLAGSRFGVAGAVIGAAGGALVGERVADNAADSNMDLRFRMQQVRNAKKELQARLAASNDPGQIITFRHGSGKGGTPEDANKELRRQTDLLNRAVAAANQPKGGPPGVNVPPFLAPKGAKPKKGPEDRSDELLAQMDKEIIQATRNILQAKQSLAGSSEEHLQIAVQLVQLDKSVKEAAIDEEVAKAKRENAEGKITDAALVEAEHKAEILKADAEIEAQIKLRAIVEAELAKAEAAQFQKTEQQLQFQQDALHTADQLATTAADHRRIQLEILDAETEQKRLQLEKNKLDAIRNGATQQEIDNIQAQIDHLPTERAQGAAIINQNTMGPLEAWLHSIPHEAKAATEALQSIETEGLDNLASAMAEVVTGTKSLKDAFSDVAQSIISDIIQMTVRMLIFKAISGLLGGSSTPSGALGFGGDMSDGSSSLYGNPFHFAGGGGFTIMGNRGVDKNMLSLNGLPIANVSYGERVSVGNDNGSGGGGSPTRVIVELNDGMLSARIAEGAGRVVMRAHPTLKADTIKTINDQRRRAS